MRFICFITILFSLGFNIFAQSGDSSFDSDIIKVKASFEEDLRSLTDPKLKGRAPGSEGERLAAEYVFRQLSECGLEMLNGVEGDVFNIARSENDTLTSRNIVGVLQGGDSKLKEEYIVVGARLDNLGTNIVNIDGVETEQIYSGANANASGVSMLLNLARYYSSRNVRPRRSIVFAVFGSSTAGFVGSWYFLNRSFPDPDKIRLMIDLEALGAGNEVYSYAYANRNLENGIKNLNRYSLVSFDLLSQEPFMADSRVFYQSKIPTVLLTSGIFPEYNTVKDVSSLVDFEQLTNKLYGISDFVDGLVADAGSFSYLPSSVVDNAVTYQDCDVKPTFFGKGLEYFLSDWVYKYLRYPESAIESAIQGKVVVQFILNEKGKVVDAYITRSIDEALDKEALRVVKASPDWKPARKDGVAVPCIITIPIEFRLKSK